MAMHCTWRITDAESWIQARWRVDGCQEAEQVDLYIFITVETHSDCPVRVWMEAGTQSRELTGTVLAKKVLTQWLDDGCPVINGKLTITDWSHELDKAEATCQQ